MHINAKFAIAAALMLTTASAALASHHLTPRQRHELARHNYASVRQDLSARRAWDSARQPVGGCHLRWGERPEELTQDRDYQESLGKPC
jgi:hypothetical protein